MSDMAEAQRWKIVILVDVHLDLPSANPEVVLQETEPPGRQLRFPVGMAEGTAIAYGLRNIATARPLTHQLVADLLDGHGVEVSALRITARDGSTYVAELDTIGPKGQRIVPCRPSDGLALVARRRLPTPVLVAEELLEPPRPSAAPEGAGVTDSG